MTDFLLFTLYAPLSSWGDIAVGEMRGTWDRPSRSAVLGLVAAALGLLREDQAAHDALDAGYGVATRLDASGVPSVDYHTAQTVAASVVNRKRPPTRAALLAAGDRETILSRRSYLEDSVATAALWARPGARWTLEALRDALLRPKFVLYAGRKANAFGLPLGPEIVEGATLSDALARRASLPPALTTFPRSAIRTWRVPAEVAHDRCEGFDSGLLRIRTTTRRDAGTNRAKWQFRERVVEVGVMAAPPEGAAS